MSQHYTVVGLKEVKIEKLNLPGNWNEILEDPEARKRGESIKQVGLIHEPLVRKSDMKVLAGRYRIAGHKLMGKDTVRVKFVECTDYQAKQIELIENLERRHDPEFQGKLLQEWVELLTEEELGDPANAKPGKRRRTSAQQKARERIARERGIKPDSVRKAQQRFKERQRERIAQQPVPTPAIKMLGMEADEDWLKDVAEVQEIVREVRNRLSVALAGLSKLKGKPYPEGRLDRIREALQSVSAQVGSSLPASICPYCKNMLAALHQCAKCVGLGYVAENQLDGIPEELLDEQDPKIMIQGKMFSAADIAEGAHREDLRDEDEDGEQEEDDPWPVR